MISSSIFRIPIFVFFLYHHTYHNGALVPGTRVYIIRECNMLPKTIKHNSIFNAKILSSTTEASIGLHHRALLVFVAARDRLGLDGCRGCHVVLAWIKDETRVTDVKKDRSEGDHAIQLSDACHCQKRGGQSPLTRSPSQ